MTYREIDAAATFDAISRWCLACCQVDRLLVTARNDLSRPRELDEPRVAETVAELFGGRVLEEIWASAWPGTSLGGGGASKLWRIAFDEEVRARMVAMENRLVNWHQWHEPPLPADVCLYREGDPMPVLVSMSHQREPWFGAWLLDTYAADAPFATDPELPLPLDLIPARSGFVVRTRGR